MPCQVTETLAWTFLKSIFPDRLISQALLQPWIVSSHGSQVEVNNFERHPSLHEVLLQIFAPSGSKIHADVPFSSHRWQTCFHECKETICKSEGGSSIPTLAFYWPMPRCQPLRQNKRLEEKPERTQQILPTNLGQHTNSPPKPQP